MLFFESLQKIIITQKSLFKLSEYFFAKREKMFLSYWHKVRTEYPHEFWVSFWSEQLWQAALFLAIMKEKRVATIEKHVRRLPFSFVKRDWRRCNKREIIVAHNFLYHIDYRLKSGRAMQGLIYFS